MYRLPPITRSAPAKLRQGTATPTSLETAGAASHGYNGLQASQDTESQSVEIRVNDTDFADICDIQMSVRGAMGSPIPRRTIDDEVLGSDRRVLMSRHRSHPKITIDTCADFQRSSDRGAVLGQAVTRSVSTGTLFAPPRQETGRQGALSSALSDQKLPTMNNWSEGNIPRGMKYNSDPFDLSGHKNNTHSHDNINFRGRKTTRNVPHYSRGRSTSRSATDTQSIGWNSPDSESRPTSPTPDGPMRSSHLSPANSPPSSPRVSPRESPVPQSRLSVISLDSKGHPMTLSTDSLRATRGNPTSPKRTARSLSNSPRRHVTGGPRLLPLRTEDGV